MKFFTLSIVVTSLILIGCGGSSKNPKDISNNIEETKNIEEAQKNLSALNVLESIDLPELAISLPNSNKILNKFTNKEFNQLQKKETVACSDGGSMTYDIPEYDILDDILKNEKTIVYTFDSCQNGSTYMDGKMEFVQKDDNSFEIDLDKLTFRHDSEKLYMDINIRINEEAGIETANMNGTINQTTKTDEKNNITLTNFIIKTKETSDESWRTIDGSMKLDSKCIAEKYLFETVEKLVDAKDGSDNLESGILKLNGATYTFNNPYVTIKVGSESKTMLQNELEERMEELSSC